ncbi:MAG: HlyD family efflux transporter periplasmic adaptor subunit [Firmicutes bacterium]|nr:HlyD family efflux transporter periplasmic adaptor subunit [Bacillota bacterium]
MASHTVTADIGLSQGDVNSIQTGMEATVTVNQKEFQGTVIDVALLPDTTSRTYQARIAIEEETGLNLGETAAVQINTGPREGIWLSLPTIMNDGERWPATSAPTWPMCPNLSSRCPTTSTVSTIWPVMPWKSSKQLRTWMGSSG